MQKHNIKICCFLGHRKIEITTEQKTKLENIIENLIVNKNVKVFLFGSKSAFDDLCYDIVSKLKEKYADIKRVYVRSVYEFMSEIYQKHLLQFFEETIYAEKCKGAGRLSYVKRNFEMIDKSDICVFYYNAEYLPPDRQFNHKSSRRYQPKSGTALAYKYAYQKKKEIINIFKCS